MNKFYCGRVMPPNSELHFEVFEAPETPTEESHGEKYAYVVGPFGTKKAADFMAKYGPNNPHVQSVEDAERLAEKEHSLVGL